MSNVGRLPLPFSQAPESTEPAPAIAEVAFRTLTQSARIGDPILYRLTIPKIETGTQVNLPELIATSSFEALSNWIVLTDTESLFEAEIAVVFWETGTQLIPEFDVLLEMEDQSLSIPVVVNGLTIDSVLTESTSFQALLPPVYQQVIPSALFVAFFLTAALAAAILVLNHRSHTHRTYPPQAFDKMAALHAIRAVKHNYATTTRQMEAIGEILKRFISLAFRVNATGTTTHEFLALLQKETTLPRHRIDGLAEILAVVDLAKYADIHPDNTTVGFTTEAACHWISSVSGAVT
jgi:hypothetical protein